MKNKKLSKKELRLLDSWGALNEGIADVNTATARALLSHELKNKVRPTFIKRIKSRIVAATTEDLDKELSKQELK